MAGVSVTVLSGSAACGNTRGSSRWSESLHGLLFTARPAGWPRWPRLITFFQAELAHAGYTARARADLAGFAGGRSDREHGSAPARRCRPRFAAIVNACRIGVTESRRGFRTCAGRRRARLRRRPERRHRFGRRRAAVPDGGAQPRAGRAAALLQPAAGRGRRAARREDLRPAARARRLWRARSTRCRSRCTRPSRACHTKCTSSTSSSSCRKPTSSRGSA